MFPKLFTIGDYFTVHTYGVLVALGMLLGIYTAARYAPRAGLTGEALWNLGVYTCLAGLLGAKVFLVVSEWDYYSQHPREILSWTTLQVGGVFYGGLLAALAIGGWYAWRQRLAFSALGDAAAPGLALGHTLGRLGCFAAGCCWGKPAALPWAVTFTNSYSAWMVGVPLGIPLHPTQLYEAFAEAAIFAILVWLWRRRRFAGEILSSYLMLYATARFVIEFFRGDPRGAYLFGGALSIPQVLSAAVFVAAGVFWWWQRRHAAAPAHAR